MSKKKKPVEMSGLYANFRRNVESILERRGLARKDFSLLCGFDHPNKVWSLLSGQRSNPTLATVERVAAALMVDPVYLLTDHRAKEK